MKRMLMLLALVLCTVLVCSSCQVSEEKLLAQIEEAAVKGDFETVRNIQRKNWEIFEVNTNKLAQYYNARESEYKGESPFIAWYTYVAETPGFLDSDARGQALAGQIEGNGYLFDMDYDNAYFPEYDKYDLFVTNGELFKVEAPYMFAKDSSSEDSGRIASKEQSSVVKLGYRYAMINQDGALLTAPEWSALERWDGYFVGVYADSEVCCLLDKTGQVVVKAPWGTIDDVNAEERVLILSHNGKYGFIDFDGNVISEAVWSEVRDFHDGYAAVKDSDWGLIDMRGNVVVETKFDKISDVESGYAIATLRNSGKLYTNVIDMQGNVINPYKWSYTTPEFIDGAAAVRNEQDRWDLIDAKGNVLSGGWLSIKRTDYGVSVVEGRGTTGMEVLISRYGLIDNAGNVVLEPCMDEIEFFSEGYATFRKGREQGYMDPQGNIISAPRVSGDTTLIRGYGGYEEVVDLGEGFIKGMKVDAWGEKSYEIVNTATGETIGGSGLQEISNVFNGKILVKKDKQYYLLDCQTGTTEAVFQRIRSF